MNAPVLVLAVLTLAFAGAAVFAFTRLGNAKTALALADERLRMAEAQQASNAELLKAQAAPVG